MPSHRHTLILALAAIALMPIQSFAQESAPATTPAAVVCSVLPRPEADLIAASASPVAQSKFSPVLNIARLASSTRLSVL